MALERFVKDRLDRRRFLESSARNAAGVAAGMVGLSGSPADAATNDRVRLGVIGVRARGKVLASTFAGFPDVEVATVCDVDANQLPIAAAEIASVQQHAPAAASDFRRILDDPCIDAVVVATPDHWHAPMTILACQADKDVYVEKPVSHNVAEGNHMLDVVRETNRVVQCGLQQRSGEHFQSAVELVQTGQLGTVKLARAWTSHRRKPLPASRRRQPQGVNYDMWLGPAPRRSFSAARFHHNWRWFWDYGAGELGNWGVHMLDVARWGMKLDLPGRISASGGCYHLNDGRETPDTLVVNFNWPDATIVWEHRQWTNRPIEGRSAGVAFYGDKGTLLIDRSGWKVYDSTTNESCDGNDSLLSHCRNFIDCVKTRSQPSCDLETGHLSSALCHLGNIATRTGREIKFAADGMLCPNDDEANQLLARVSRDPWNVV